MNHEKTEVTAVQNFQTKDLVCTGFRVLSIQDAYDRGLRRDLTANAVIQRPMK